MGASFAGLWLALIGWFLLDAARSSYAQARVLSELRGHMVGEMMEQDWVSVEGSLALRDLVDEYLLHTGHRCFVVTQGERAVGVITPEEIKAVEREQWPRTSVQSVTRPLEHVRTIAPETPAAQALELMAREGINQVPVVSDAHVKGLLSRNQILRFFAAVHKKLVRGPSHGQDRPLLSCCRSSVPICSLLSFAAPLHSRSINGLDCT